VSETACPACKLPVTLPRTEAVEAGNGTLAFFVTDPGTFHAHLRDAHPDLWAHMCEMRRRMNTSPRIGRVPAVSETLTAHDARLAAVIEAHLEEDEKHATAASTEGPNWRQPDPERFPGYDPERVFRRAKATRSLVTAILAEPHYYNASDEFYSCSQAVDPDPCPGEGGPGSGCLDDERAGRPCDCGRDARVARLLSIIASEWEDS
jgi:hypothetical protein